MEVAVIRINAQPDDLPVTTYKRAAYEAIRDMIVELEIPPGSPLVESDLAARLRVSKPRSARPSRGWRPTAW